jgi:hypothetical protein
MEYLLQIKRNEILVSAYLKTLFNRNMLRYGGIPIKEQMYILIGTGQEFRAVWHFNDHVRQL